jgi:hypothetical protein
MSKSNDVLSGPARKRLNLLQRVQQLCQSGGEFSMHKLIKSYSLDPNISAIMQEIGLVERSGTDKFPKWRWIPGIPPNVSHVNKIMEIQKERRQRQQARRDKRVTIREKPQQRNSHVSLKSLSDQELKQRLIEVKKEFEKRGYIITARLEESL